MTEELQRKVLALWGLESFEKATRESWPWWRERWEKGERTFLMPDMITGEMVPEREDVLKATPRMPDFAADDAAAVKLAARMQAFAIWDDKGGVCIDSYRDPRTGDELYWPQIGNSPPMPRGETLGAALLAALERGE